MKIYMNENIELLKSSYRCQKRMWSYLGEWKAKFFFGFIFGNTSSFVMNLFMSYIWKVLIEIGQKKDYGNLKKEIVMLLVLAAVISIFYSFCFGLLYTTFAKMFGRLQLLIYKHTQKLSFHSLGKNGYGDVLTKVTSDLDDAIQLVGYPVVGLNNPFSRIIGIVGSAIVVICCDVKLGLISLVIGILGVIVTVSFARPIKKVEKKIKEATDHATQNVLNILCGLDVVQMYGLQKKMKKKYFDSADQIYDCNLKAYKKKATLNAVSKLLGAILFLGVTVIGLVMANNGLIAVSSVVFIANMQQGFTVGMVQLGKQYAELQRYYVGAERLFQFLDLPEEEKVEKKEEVCPQSDDYALKIDNMTFGYDDVQKKIFNSFHLHLKKGENVAIVGESGSGKSTLLKILLGFVNVEKGTIQVEGKNIEDYEKEELRKNFSYVPQMNYLFNMSIWENIKCGNPDASDSEVEEAAKKANVEDFIEELPDKYDTIVGEKGGLLSGGQRQRICIARAFLKNAPIVLLDEPTSSLDTGLEEKVLQALGSLFKDKSVLIVAHKLSTIRKADRILVMERGRIVEEGTHDKLMKKEGLYKRLYETQKVQ